MDRVQPPRYTSTPRAERNTSALLNNFLEVSPILLNLDHARKTKSSFPVVTTTESIGKTRPTSIPSLIPRLKGTISTNKSDDSSSGSVKIPPQNPKSGAEKKTTSQGIKQLGGTVLSQVAKNKTPEKDSTKSAKLLEVQKEVGLIENRRPSSVDEVIESVVTHSEMKSKTSPQDTNVRASTKSTKLLEVQKDIGLMENRRCSSVDEVIESVVTHSEMKSKTLPQDTNVRDDPRVKLNKMSRPSSLTVVPEEVTNEDTVQPPDDGILKTQIPEVGWQIPTDIKNRISLKRKSSVAQTITKRKKPIKVVDSKENDESLFDSPELPNLIQVSSLSNKRQTYELKKKPELTNIVEERQECNTEGISPLQIISQENENNTKSVPASVNDRQSKETKRKSKKTKENTSRDEKIGPKRTLRERKPNRIYCDTSDININDLKGNANKNKKEDTLKLSQGDKENLQELPSKSKAQRKKTTAKKESANDEMNHSQAGVAERASDDVITDSYASKAHTSGELIGTNDNPIPIPKTSGKRGRPKSSVQSKKKEPKPVKKGKEVTTTVSKLRGERKEEQTETDNSKKENGYLDQPTTIKNVTGPVSNCANLDSSGGILNVKPVENTKKTSQPKKQDLTSKNEENQDNEAKALIHATGASTSKEDLKVTLHENKSKSSKCSKFVPDSSPQMKIRRKTYTKKTSAQHADHDSKLMNDLDRASDQSTKDKVSKDIAEEAGINKKEDLALSEVKIKKNSIAHKRTRNGGIQVTCNTLPDKMAEDEGCLEKEENLPSSPKQKGKSKTNDGDNSHSEPASKKSKRVHDSGKGTIKGAPYRITDLFGTDKYIEVLESQPGVMTYKLSHISNFAMMGDVRLQPGASLSKITTNTFYSVVEGAAEVNIENHLKTYKASDEHTKFFIPKNLMNVAITNVGDGILKLDFYKFKV